MILLQGITRFSLLHLGPYSVNSRTETNMLLFLACMSCILPVTLLPRRLWLCLFSLFPYRFMIVSILCLLAGPDCGGGSGAQGTAGQDAQPAFLP